MKQTDLMICELKSALKKHVRSYNNSLKHTIIFDIQFYGEGRWLLENYATKMSIEMFMEKDIE